MSRVATIILSAVALTACSESPAEKKEVILELIKNCSEPASVELTLRQYGSTEFKVRCSKIGGTIFKSDSK